MDIDTIHIARDVLWSFSFSSLALFISFRSRQASYSKYSHTSLLLWSIAAAMRLVIHNFLHIDKDLPKVIRLFQEPSFSFYPSHWSVSIYTKHSFLWSTLLNLPPLIFICSCVPTLLGWSIEGISLKLQRKQNDFSAKKLLLLAVFITFAVLAAAQISAGHNALQLLQAKGAFFLSATTLFTHVLDVLSVIPQVIFAISFEKSNL